MKFDSFTTRTTKLVLLAALGISFSAGAAPDPDNNTSIGHQPGTFSLYPFGQFLFGSHIKNAIGPGGGFAYNICDQAAVTLEGYVGDMDTRINGINGTGTTYDATVNFEYKIMKGARFSPYLTLGVGVFNYDSKDFDPNPKFLNIASTGIMGGGGVGVSYEFNQHWFFKGCLRVWGTSVHNVDVLYGPTLALGYTF